MVSVEPRTSELLIEATIESLHRFGLDGTTVSTVTELAGLSRGMVRHEFSSKHAMLVGTMESMCVEWTAATQPPEDVDAAAQIEWIVRAMFAADVFTDARIDAWLALSAAAAFDDGLRSIRERAYSAWLAQLRAAFDAAGVENSTICADAVLAAADGLWMRHRLDPAALVRVDAERTARAVAHALLTK